MKLKIPVVMGPNRLRGKSTGAMIDDDHGEDNLGRLRQFMAEEAKAAGVTPDAAWITNSVQSLLRMYEKAQAEWVEDKGDSIGHVFEGNMPSGNVVLMGDRRVLARLPEDQTSDKSAPDQQRTFYHGSKTVVSGIGDTRDQDGILLSASASVNVAQRYGKVISKFALKDDVIAKRVSVADWFSHVDKVEDLLAANVSVVIVEADPARFDFPAETVFVLRPDALRFLGQVSTAEIAALDDDKTATFEPQGPSDRGWDLYVASTYNGNLRDALVAAGWESFDDGCFRVTVPGVNMRPWMAVAGPAANGGFFVEHNFCTDRHYFDTLSEVLDIADNWKKSEQTDRNLFNLPLLFDELDERVTYDVDTNAKEFFDEMNFQVWETGGGCVAYGTGDMDGDHILVTDADGGRLPDRLGDTMIGLYHGTSEPIKLSEPESRVILRKRTKP